MKDQGVTSDASAIIDMSFEITGGSTFAMMMMVMAMTYASTTGSANDATAG